MTNETLKILKTKLPHGSIKKLAAQTGMSEQSVSKVLEGEWTNKKITDAAIQLLKQEHLEIGELLEKLEEDKTEPLAMVA